MPRKRKLGSRLHFHDWEEALRPKWPALVSTRFHRHHHPVVPQLGQAGAGAGGLRFGPGLHGAGGGRQTPHSLPSEAMDGGAALVLS